MLEMFQILDINDGCQGLGPIVAIVKHGLFPIVQYAIPIALIALGTIDLGKAVIASDDKEVKAAQKRLIQRCIYAVLIFFIVTIVTIVMGLVSKGVDNADDSENINTKGWASCWNNI